MAKILLDNLMKVFTQNLALAGAAAASVEMDFDIPRGYVIKIHFAALRILNLVEDFETISVDKLATITGALVKDPDDITSVNQPSGVVDHDVLMDLHTSILIMAGTAGDPGMIITNAEKEANFAAEGLDVITARNMRLNVDGAGTDVADLTESQFQCTVHYTLERITDADILALLDII